MEGTGCWRLPGGTAHLLLRSLLLWGLHRRQGYLPSPLVCHNCFWRARTLEVDGAGEIKRWKTRSELCSWVIRDSREVFGSRCQIHGSYFPSCADPGSEKDRRIQIRETKNRFMSADQVTKDYSPYESVSKRSRGIGENNGVTLTAATAIRDEGMSTGPHASAIRIREHKERNVQTSQNIRRNECRCAERRRASKRVTQYGVPRACFCFPKGRESAKRWVRPTMKYHEGGDAREGDASVY